MSYETDCYDKPVFVDDFVPGTCVVVSPRPRRQQDGLGKAARDPDLRTQYLARAFSEMPRLIGAVDRNPYRPTYGCFDREHWHYRTASFASQMYQEGVLPLAMVYATRLPGNVWYKNQRVRELAIAGIHFAAKNSHSDGSCDDYYPYERALGAAVFSLQAAASAYRLLEIDDPKLVDWFRCRSRWMMENDESGNLTNHHALAALGLLYVSQITGDETFRRAADERIEKVLSWQDEEGWFEEYGGADPGYQTITIDCLAKYRQLTGDERLERPLYKATQFARLFLHPDYSYGGEYGSRGTQHFFPHGMELLASRNPDAADLADGFLHSLANGTNAHFGDDRMFIHQIASLIGAYKDWSSTRPESRPTLKNSSTHYFDRARLIVRRTSNSHTVISGAKCGAFKHFSDSSRPMTDAGLIVETTDGRIAVSNMQSSQHKIDPPFDVQDFRCSLTVVGNLNWAKFETISPPKQMLLHFGMLTIGRWCRTAVRKMLQKRLITGRHVCPIRLTRSFEFLDGVSGDDDISVRITDTIELTDPKIRLRRMAFGNDHFSTYVAACGVYQESAITPWLDLAQYIDTLNRERKVTIVREQ